MDEKDKLPPEGGKPQAQPRAKAPEEKTPPVAAAAVPSTIVDDDEDVGILTESEKEKIRNEVRAKLKLERHKSALAQFRAEEERRLRMEEGMTVGGVKDDMVTITLDLAKHSSCIMIDMRPYWHGQTYTVPRHLADSLAEMQFRGWGHQYEIDGKSRYDFYQSIRETTISPVKGTKNAARPPALPGQG